LTLFLKGLGEQLHFSDVSFQKTLFNGQKQFNPDKVIFVEGLFKYLKVKTAVAHTLLSTS
jgi:hypothetical protein